LTPSLHEKVKKNRKLKTRTLNRLRRGFVFIVTVFGLTASTGISYATVLPRGGSIVPIEVDAIFSGHIIINLQYKYILD
jgi:hypothetical protein